MHHPLASSLRELGLQACAIMSDAFLNNDQKQKPPLFLHHKIKIEIRAKNFNVRVLKIRRKIHLYEVGI